MSSRLAAFVLVLCAAGCGGALGSAADAGGDHGGGTGTSGGAGSTGSGGGSGGAGGSGSGGGSGGGASTGDDGGALHEDGGAAAGDGGSTDHDGGTSSTDGGSGGASAIDWSPWSLQEPDNKTQTTLTGYKDSYFYPHGSYQAFMDTMTGTTTSGSAHPRCELRETKTWLASGKSTLTVTGHVTQLGGGTTGKTTVGQVFNDDDSIPLAELIYQAGGKFEVLYEEAKGGGSYTPSSVAAALGTDYTYELSLAGGQLTVTVNGTTVLTKTPSAAVSGNHFYFKAGNYDQTATSGADSTTPYTVVENSAIHIAHQ